MRIRCQNPNRATNSTLMHAHQRPLTLLSQLFATSPREIALYPFTIFRERLIRLSKIKTFSVRPSISLPLYRNVNPPVTKSESCPRHSLKRNEKMGSKHYQPSSHRSKTPPSLNQPQLYIASRTLLDPYAGAHHALAYPRSAVLRQTASSLFSHLFTALEHRQTSYRKAFGWKYADGNGVTIV